MYFIFSSLFSFATQPVFYILCPLLAGRLLRNRKWKRGMYVAAAVLALLFTNSSLLNFAKEQWYKEYDHPLPAGSRYKYGIVLGGYSNWDWQRNRAEFSEIADRLLEGIRLYKQGRIEKLVLASDGSIIESAEPKGNPAGMMRFLQDMGMPPQDVIMETRARNTRENATLTLELVGDDLRRSPSLLITSATHMRRSLASFRAVGLEPAPYITDTPFQARRKGVSLMPSLATLLQWPELIHEWIGCSVYRLKGWNR